MEIPILVLREKKIDYDAFNFHGGRSPWIQTTSGFDLMIERLDKSSEIFLSWISKNFEKLVKRKFIEWRVGLGALFNIKLNNVFETNVVDDIRGKGEDIVYGSFQVEVNEHEHVCFPKTCKKTIKSLRKLLEKEIEVELKVIKKKYMLNKVTNTSRKQSRRKF